MARACWWHRRKTMERCIDWNKTVIWHFPQNIICDTECMHTFDIFALAEIFSLRAPHHPVLERYFQPSSCRHCTSWKKKCRTKRQTQFKKKWLFSSFSKMDAALMVMSQRVLKRHRSLSSNNIHCWLFVSPLWPPWFSKYAESRTQHWELAVLTGFVGDCKHGAWYAVGDPLWRSTQF